MKSTLKPLLCFILLCLFSNIFAQAPEITWEGYYPKGTEIGTYSAMVMRETPDGEGLMIVGNLDRGAFNDIFVMRLDADGEFDWIKYHGGSWPDTIRDDDDEIIDIIDIPWDQKAEDMCITPEGTFLITGYRDTTKRSEYSIYELLLMEVDSEGNLLNDSVFRNKNEDWVMGYNIQPSHQGGYLLSGKFKTRGLGSDKMFSCFVGRVETGEFEATGFPYYLVTTIGSEDGSGYPTWMRPFEDGYLLAGMCVREGSKHDIFLQKIDKDCYPVWTKYYGTAESDGFKDGIISGDTIYLAGYASVPVEGSAYESDQIYLLKCMNDGTIIWERTYGQSALQHYAASLLRTGDGNLLVAGTSYKPDHYSEILLTEIDPNSGDTLWMETYGDFLHSGTSEITRTFDYGYALAGRGSYSASQDPHIYMMKVQNSATTAMQWAREGLNLEIVRGTPTKDVINVSADKIKFYGIMVNIDELLHPNAGDLELTLEHGGVEVTLVDRLNKPGANFINTHFFDMAEQSINWGIAPYTGFWMPQETLLPFLWSDPSGVWTLTVYDHGTGGKKSTSVLDDWSLNLLVEKGDGTGLPTQEAMMNFGLEQLRPNPLATETVIRFKLASTGSVHLKVYNQLGQEVAHLVDEELDEGVHERTWYPGPLAPGTYFIHLESGGMVSVRKALLTR